LESTRAHLAEIPIGGTAVGTGLNAHPEFGARVVTELRSLTGFLFRRAPNAFEAMQNRDARGVVGCRRRSPSGSGISNDLRF
jgi:fumarate hydratase class II